MAHMRNVRKELKAMKKMFTIHPDGTYTTNDKESPLAADMVVYHTDKGNLKIEAPCNGCFSTADQRRTVNTLAGKWLESKKSLTGIAANGEITVRENKSVDNGVEVHYIIASTDGKVSDEEAVAGAGLIGEWVGKTAKKDTAKKPTAAPAAAASGDDKKATPPAEPDKKSTPPAEPDKKATPPAEPDKKADPAPAAPDPEPTKSAPAPDKKAGVHWDPNLSVDENIERLWNA